MWTRYYLTVIRLYRPNSGDVLRLGRQPRAWRIVAGGPGLAPEPYAYGDYGRVYVTLMKKVLREDANTARWLQ